MTMARERVSLHREMRPNQDQEKETTMAGQTWTLDTAHSIMGFWVRHLMVTKLDVEDGGRAKHPMTGDQRAGFSAHTTIQRSDFGLKWNAVLEAGGVAVSDKVEINLDLQAFRPA